MKVECLHIWRREDKPWQVNATIQVDGLGEVKISHALSEELCNRVEQEALSALRIKFGQTLEQTKAPTGEAKE